jgi:hypothetical protein
VFDRLNTLFDDPPLRDSVLVVDQTAVGKPVYDLLRKGRPRARLVRVTLTAGHKATFDAGGWLVPKLELISTLQLLLQARRLRFAPVPEAQTLIDELQAFRPRALPADNDALAWRERASDDLVLATAIAAWQAERQREVGALAGPYVLEPVPRRGWRW